MLKLVRNLFVSMLVAACVEPYEFVVLNTPRGIAVEAHLSDRSFNETLSYPSDGRYLTVRLTYTSDVENTRSEKVHGASVQLIDDHGGSRNYEENAGTGVYFISDRDFKALPGVKYKLDIRLPGEAKIESEWRTLPDGEQQGIGTVGFREVVRQTYRYEAGERVIRPVKGIDVHISVPENPTEASRYYRWTIHPLYIFEAANAARLSSGRRCWVTDSLYITDYVVREDHTGGYSQWLFFMETVRNERIYKKFSALVKQEILAEDHFFFWKEMQERNQGGFTHDTPPYNLNTNLTVTEGDVSVYGFFSPVREQATRWYFDKRDLSYFVIDTSAEDCDPTRRDPAPHCFSCLSWQWGKVTNQKPPWWEDG